MNLPLSIFFTFWLIKKKLSFSLFVFCFNYIKVGNWSSSKDERTNFWNCRIPYLFSCSAGIFLAFSLQWYWVSSSFLIGVTCCYSVSFTIDLCKVLFTSWKGCGIWRASATFSYSSRQHLCSSCGEENVRQWYGSAWKSI